MKRVKIVTGWLGREVDRLGRLQTSKPIFEKQNGDKKFAEPPKILVTALA